MIQLPITHTLSVRLDDSEALSALPGAPVVPYVEPIPHLHRTRAAIAAALYRLGDVLAPARPVCNPRSLG